MSIFKDSPELEKILGGYFREAVMIPKGERALIDAYIGILIDPQNRSLAEEFFDIMTDGDKKLIQQYLGYIAGGNPEQIKQTEAEILKQGKFVEETLQSAQMILRFNLREPDLSIIIDATENPIGVYINDQTRKPSADFSLKAEFANKFWNGKVNLAIALTKKDIVARGSIPKILKLVKILGPMYGFYKLYLKKLGRADLILS